MLPIDNCCQDLGPNFESDCHPRLEESLNDTPLMIDMLYICYKWHAGLLWVAYCIVTGAMHAVMHGMSCNHGCGKPTMGPDDNGGSGG